MADHWLTLSPFPAELKSHTKCIFGISPRPATFPYHTQDLVFYKGWSYLVVSAPGDRVYWFLFCAVPTAYGKDIPRYTKEDEAELANQHLNDNITETVTFRDLYDGRHIATLVPLQEHVFTRWHFRRIITIGDSAHKVHPITAQGGNGAIESAARLVNAISRGLDMSPQTQGLSEEALEAAFAEVYHHRYNRARDVVKQGEQMQSITNLQGPFSGLMIRYLVPLLGDTLFLNSFLKTSLAGPRIEKIHLPERPHAVPFNDERPVAGGYYSWVLWAVGVLGSGFVAMVCWSKGYTGLPTGVLTSPN